MTRSVEIPDETTFAALRAFDGKQGYSKLERMRAALEAAVPYLAPAEPVEICYNDGPPHPRTECHRDRCGLDAAAPAGDGGLREALERIARGDVPLHTPAAHFARDALAAHPAAPAVPQPAKARRHCTCEVGMGTYPGDHHERGCQLNPVEVSDEDVKVAAEQAEDWRNDILVDTPDDFPGYKQEWETFSLLPESAVPQPAQGVSTTDTSVVSPVDREALEQKIAEAIDRNYDEDAYLPVYSKEGYIVTSGAARAVLAVLAGEQEQAGP